MSYIGNTPFTAAFLTDTFSGDSSTTGFTLSAAPANTSSLIVAVSGVLQDPSTYSVSGTTLTFSAAPPTGTDNISVRFLGIPASGVTTTAYRTVTEFTATAGQTSFSVPSYTAGYVDVYRNGVMLGTADFTATSGTTVVLASGATAGDLIRVESFYVSSVLNAIPATAGAVNTSYISDAAVTQAKLGSGVAGNGPAFSATRTASTQSISTSTWTKLQFTDEVFDTANCFDSSTNYRFTPTVAGYYQTNWSLVIEALSATTEYIVALYKNGSNYSWATNLTSTSAHYNSTSGSELVYLNGSSDYLELYVIQDSGSTKLAFAGGASYPSRFSSVLVRAA